MASQKLTVLGSYGDLKPNNDAQEVADAVREDLEKAVGKKFEMYTAILYKTQVVAGLNYLISIQIGPHTSCHIVAYRSFDKQVSLVAHQIQRKLYAPLMPIQVHASSCHSTTDH